MSRLGDEIGALQDVIRTMPQRRALPAPDRRPTRRALEKIMAGLDAAVQKPQEARLAIARREILAAQRAGTELRQLPVRILRDGVWLLWPEVSDGIRRDVLRDALLVTAGNSNAVLRRLIDVWLLHFAERGPGMPETGRRIAELLAARPGAGHLTVWRAAHEAFSLFDAAEGPKRLAAAILSGNPEDPLAACRLDNPIRATGGYLRAVHAALSTQVSAGLARSNAIATLQRAITFYWPDKRLRFDEMSANGLMADGLVAPWTGTTGTPSDTIRTEILTYLRDRLGDPRVNAQRWNGARDITRSTVREWLSSLSLDAFFREIGRFAENAGMDHQWEKRQAFWNACLKRKFISDSWLALGANVVRSVRANRELQNSYGHLSGGDPNHSVLLMKIGNLIFAEWSHNGSVRAWNENSNDAPRLFKRTYERSELTRPCLQFPPPIDKPHLPTLGANGLQHHDGVWQGRVAALLRRRTSLTLQPRDWAV